MIYFFKKYHFQIVVLSCSRFRDIVEIDLFWLEKNGPSSKIFKNFKSQNTKRLGPKQLEFDDEASSQDAFKYNINEETRENNNVLNTHRSNLNTSFFSMANDDLSQSQLSIRDLAISQPKKAISQLAMKYAEKKLKIQKLEYDLSTVSLQDRRRFGVVRSLFDRAVLN